MVNVEALPFVNQKQLCYIFSNNGKPRSTNYIVGLENRGEIPAHFRAGSDKLWNKQQLAEMTGISIEQINQVIKNIPAE